ncbi:MAG: DNA polymerase ligase N-terminal domain-containing protein [Nanoarchaeota archaeon]
MTEKIFVVQKHFASHLHWDLRIEQGGVLKSWAVPKEPTNEANIKRLAIQTDDHDLSYAGFEGEIPKRHYGAGTVKIWDKGTYKLIDKSDFKLEIELDGKKLNGKFVLVQMKGKQWLLFKKDK